MSEGVFTIAAKRPIREEMTISRNTGLGTSNSATWFSLGAGTSITPESYDVHLYRSRRHRNVSHR